jgi:hypothetical protein
VLVGGADSPAWRVGHEGLPWPDYKQANTLRRWAAVEAVQMLRTGPIGHTRVRIGERRGANIGKVAAAGTLLTLLVYGLRDAHIRCLSRPA